MKVIKIQLEDRHIDALCKTYGYASQVTVDEELVDNPISKKDFASEQIVRFIDEVAGAYEINEVAKVAREQKIEDVKLAPKSTVIE